MIHHHNRPTRHDRFPERGRESATVRWSSKPRSRMIVLTELMSRLSFSVKNDSRASRSARSTAPPMTMELRSSRCAKLSMMGDFSGDASSEAWPVHPVCWTRNSEIGRIFFGINVQPATITARVKPMTRMIEAGDQIVEPGDHHSGGLLEEMARRRHEQRSAGGETECQTAPAPASVASINRKSTPMPLRSASLQK